MMPGAAAISLGRVWHRRSGPTTHEFSYPVNHIWIDPDRPEDLFANHPLWSATKRRPVRFRRSDYLDGADGPLGPAIRDRLADATGHRPDGPLRMLTQPRTWGWLFNPITVYLAWSNGSDGPSHAVLEVTNTPWKERTTYPVALGHVDGAFEANFDKELHVSPFLEQDYRYHLSIRPGPSEDFDVAIDVIPKADREAEPIVKTALTVKRRPPTRSTLAAALTQNPLATHRVSLGIHAQAARLLAKRVPFVPHPKRTP
jgi:DUF1365 family protein